MNLTQTKRWSEFDIWYKENYPYIPFRHNSYQLSFLALPFEFQEGVYRKFIESLGYKISIHNYFYDNEVVYSVEIKGFVYECSTFQKLVEEIFTNTNG